MAKKKTKSKTPETSFEESLESLQDIVTQLEDGNLSLSDSLEKYEAGIKHLKSCYKLLQRAQKKIEVLVALDEHGNLKTKSFDGSATQFDSGDLGESADDEAIDGSDRLF